MCGDIEKMIKNHLKGYLKLCRQCDYVLEIVTGNDEFFADVAKDEVCDCCGEKGHVIILDVFGTILGRGSFCVKQYKSFTVKLFF